MHHAVAALMVVVGAAHVFKGVGAGFEKYMTIPSDKKAWMKPVCQFGLIARRIREQRVYSVVHPFDLSIEKIRQLAPKAIILSGGPQSVYSEAAPYCSREIFDLGVPILASLLGFFVSTRMMRRPDPVASEAADMALA